MAKRKVKSQIGNLTPDHKTSEIDPISLRSGGVQYAIENISTRATTLLQTSSRSKVCTQSYSPAKSREFQPWQFRDFHFGSPETKSHLDVGLVERCRVYYMGEGGGFLQVRAVVSLVSSKSPMARLSIKGAPTMY
jgi:hypothetical protein